MQRNPAKLDDMRALLVGMVVVCNACTPPYPIGKLRETPADRQLVAELLQAAHEPHRMDHARVRMLGTQTLDDCNDFALPVLHSREDWVQFAVHADGAILARWVPRSSLATVIARPTPVRGTTVDLWPGAPVTVRETRGDHVRIEIKHLAEKLTGWVTKDALRDTYRPIHVPPQREPPVWITNGQPLLAQPASDAPEIFANLFGGPYALLGEANGYAELAYQSDLLEARGFVPSSALYKSMPTGLCESQSNQFLVGDLFTSTARQEYVGPIEIPAGTCLRSGRRGPIIGIQLETAQKDISIERAPWGEMIAGTRWGGMAVWVPVSKHADGTFVVDPGSCP